MRKFFVIAIVFAVVFAVRGVACAEREESLKGGVYRLDEVTRTNLRTITGVPEGLSISDVVNLTTGRIEYVTAKDRVSRKTYFLFTFPLIKERTEYSNEIVTYKGGQWLVTATNRVRLSNDYWFTIFGLYIPALLIAMISITNLLYNNGTKKLLVFYGVIFAGVFAAKMFGIFFGMIIGAIAGSFAGKYAGESKNMNTYGLMSGSSSLVGLAAGSLIGVLSGALLEITPFVYFLLAIEVVSFCVAQLVEFVRDKRRARNNERIAI